MGTRTIATFPNRTQLSAIRTDLAPAVPATVADGHACDQGNVLGKITSSGLLRRLTRSTVKSGGAFTTASAAGKIVDASKKLVAGDVLKVLTGADQQETATVAGTIGSSGGGNATVIVTSGLFQGGSKNFAVAVANNDTAAQVAGKIRAALEADGLIDEYFTVGGSSATVVLTVKNPAAYDSTLNIDIDNGTCSGLTAAHTSANTTPGNAVGATLGTVQAISGDDVTLTGNAAINAGVGAIVSGSDGAETALVIADGQSDGDGDTSMDVILGGYLVESKLYGLDAMAKTELGGRSLVNGIFKF